MSYRKSTIEFTKEDYLKAEIINLKKQLSQNQTQKQRKCQWCGCTSFQGNTCVECNDL